MAIDTNALTTLVYRSATTPNDDPMTMMAWFKRNSDLNALGVLFTITDSTTQNLGAILNADGVSLSLFSTEDGETATGSSLTQDVWYHLALTRTGTSYRLWLDGVVAATQNLAAAFTPNAITLFTDSAAANPVDASCAHFRIWTSELTAAQIDAERRRTTPKAASPWGVWAFESGALTDSSGNGRDLSVFTGTPIADTDPVLPSRKSILRTP